MISGSSKARLGYMCPVDGLRQPRPPPREIARVGGHRRQPVLNRNQKQSKHNQNKSELYNTLVTIIEITVIDCNRCVVTVVNSFQVSKIWGGSGCLKILLCHLCNSLQVHLGQKNQNPFQVYEILSFLSYLSFLSFLSFPTTPSHPYIFDCHFLL